jgi:hypothetical protein
MGLYCVGSDYRYFAVGRNKLACIRLDYVWLDYVWLECVVLCQELVVDCWECTIDCKNLYIGDIMNKIVK